MFFADRIISILPNERVLDIGPGGDPHPQANVLLEINASDEELAAQRGHAPGLQTDKQIVHYDGGVFPFKDNEFDYIICSHVFEHVEDLHLFWNEVQRVGKKGYFEFPTIYYDYLYNFDVHLNLLRYDERSNTVFYMKKVATPLSEFAPVHKLFYASLTKGFDDIIRDLKFFMFQGFEWTADTPFKLKEAKYIAELTLDAGGLKQKQTPNEIPIPQPFEEVQLSTSFISKVMKRRNINE